MSERTTKYVTVTVDVIFYGDYVEANEAVGRLQSWIEAGLDDRDDLHRVRFSDGTVSEFDGDTEGYDS